MEKVSILYVVSYHVKHYDGLKMLTFCRTENKRYAKERYKEKAEKGFLVSLGKQSYLNGQLIDDEIIDKNFEE